jgi:hypothetical protein
MTNLIWAKPPKPFPDFYRKGQNRRVLNMHKGILSSLYGRNQIFQCKELFISSNDVPNIEIPLRTASIQNSLTGGQGLIFCSCKTKCTTR